MSPALQAEIVSLGCVTPVGLDAGSCEVAIRASICRYRESHILNQRCEKQVMSLVDEPYLPALKGKTTDGSEYWKRLLQLSTYALSDACQVCPIAPPLFLALPEASWKLPLPSPPRLFREMGAQAEVELDEGSSRTFQQGGASGLFAVRDALALLASGQTEFVVVGGVDSFLYLPRMAALDQENRLHGSSMDGFVPGEAAGFLLLARPGTARRHSLPSLGRIMGVGTGAESGHRYSKATYMGDGLAEAFESLFTLLPATPRIRCVYAGFNGESMPAKEWGVALLRHAERFDSAHTVEHPADCIGDSGAALGPVMLALAVEGIRKGCRESPCLIWCTSDTEARAAALLQSS